jgi:F-type H+-transporting ATPase subunit b
MFNEKFWLALAFLTFTALIIKFVWPLIAKALDAKSKKIAEEILAAKELRQKAEKFLADAEKYHTDSVQFAEKLLKDAAAETKKFAEESKHLLEVELAKKTTAAMARIKLEEESAIRELKTKIVASTFKNLEENLSKEISETQHEKINQQASEDLLKALS